MATTLRYQQDQPCPVACIKCHGYAGREPAAVSFRTETLVLVPLGVMTVSALFALLAPFSVFFWQRVTLSIPACDACMARVQDVRRTRERIVVAITISLLLALAAVVLRVSLALAVALLGLVVVLTAAVGVHAALRRTEWIWLEDAGDGYAVLGGVSEGFAQVYRTFEAAPVPKDCYDDRIDLELQAMDR